MHPLNWAIVIVYLVYVVWDGLRRARGTHEIEGYFLASRNLPWWAVGLSVMATQLSPRQMPAGRSSRSSGSTASRRDETSAARHE
jgi:Na+/proline symporter